MPEPRAPDQTTTVEWTRGDEGQLAAPLVHSTPYVEVKLEHRELEPTSLGDSFFPAAIPYELGDEHRIFYWTSTLQSTTPSPAAWTGVCATTESTGTIPHGRSVTLELTSSGEDGHEIVVDGTVAGDSTTAVVNRYDPPSIAIRHVTPDGVELDLPDGVDIVAAGARERFQLPSREVRPTASEGPVSVTPELVVRFPGPRTVYHPALAGEYRLFPSFGLDLDEIPESVAVPTQNGELDHHALADRFDVELAARPYPERTLWQAFAFAAFDPHETTPPEITQFESGLLAVRKP